jgi:hypothetical protein
MHPARQDEKQAVRQWLYCLRRSLPQKQQMVHRVMQGCIVLPCVSMGIGVVLQMLYSPLADAKAMVGVQATVLSCLKAIRKG